MQTVTLHTSNCFRPNLNHISLINVTLGSSYCQYFQCLPLKGCICNTFYRNALYCCALSCMVLSLLHCGIFHCCIVYCLVLHCIVLHCLAMHCIALHCLAWHCIYCIAISQLIFVLILITKQTTADTATTEVIKLS